MNRSISVKEVVQSPNWTIKVEYKQSQKVRVTAQRRYPKQGADNVLIKFVGRKYLERISGKSINEF